MAFPLGGAVTVAADAIVAPAVNIVGITPARTWGGSIGGDLFPPVTRAAAVAIVAPAVNALRVTAVRHWGGIGGIVYVPSFPQVPRETTFPKAF